MPFIVYLDEAGDHMSGFEYSLIVSVIKKQPHKDKYGIFAENPYDLALMFCLERLLPFLEEAGQDQIHLIAESRGKKEDNDLKLSFFNILSHAMSCIRISPILLMIL